MSVRGWSPAYLLVLVVDLASVVVIRVKADPTRTATRVV